MSATNKCCYFNLQSLKTRVMEPSNRVFTATSLDGYIADEHGGLDWLKTIPNPKGDDMGYKDFMAETDALVMDRATYEAISGFKVAWPYTKPVYVLSNSLTEVPEALIGKVWLVRGTLTEVLRQIHGKGHYRLYIDGGQVITSFLAEGLIQEMIITVFPVLLGGGHRVFGRFPKRQDFWLVSSKVCLGQLVQSYFRRKG